MDNIAINGNVKADYLQIGNAFYYKNAVQQAAIATPQKYVLNALYCGVGNQKS